MKKYLLPIALGFAGMFMAHFLLFLLSYGLKLNFMPYIIAYPITFVVLVFFLTRSNPQWWASNAIGLLLIPFIYWYWLLWSDGKFNAEDAMKVDESSGMLLIMPMTLLFVLLVSYLVSKRRQRLSLARQMP